MRRYIFVNLVFVFLTLSAYAQITPTHIWTGSANTDWNDPHNWDTGSAPQLAPDGNSIVQIKALSSTPAQYPIITTNSCHAKEIEIEAGASIDLQAQIILTQTSHSCAVKNSGLLKMHGTTAQKTWFEETSVAKKIVLESGSTVHYYDTSADALWAGPYENLIVERSISSTDLKIKGNMEVKDSTHPFTITASTKLEVVGKMHVNTSSLLTLINSPIQIYKDVEVESVSNLTFNNPITLTGTLHNKGSVNIATVNWQPSTDSMTIKNEGELTVTTLNCTPTSSATTLIIEGIDNENKTKITNLSFVGAGGKHLIIKKKIKVDGNIQLSGDSKTSILSVEGDSNDSQLQLATSTTGEGEYLKVYTNIPIVGKNYLTKKSYPHGSDSDIEAGKPENWIFDDCIIPLTWKSGGTVPTKWNEATNWLPRGIPGVNTEVIISPITITLNVQYPKLTQDESAKTVTIDNDAELDLDAFVIKSTNADTALLMLEGTVKMQGTNAQRGWLEDPRNEHTIEHLDGTTIVYYGSSTDDVWAGPYENLIVERSIKSSTTLTVEKKLEVKCGTSDVEIIATTSLVANNKVEVSGAGSAKLTITSPSQTYNEEVFTSTCPLIFNANNDVTFKKELKAIGQDVSFTGGSLKTEGAVTAKDINITFTNATWESQKAVTAHNINISGTGAKWESKEDITVTESITATSVDWKARTGNIKVQKHILADELHQSAGKLILNGSTPQNAKVKQIVELEVASGAIVNFNDSFILTGSLKNIGTLTIATLKWQASADSMNIKNEGTLQITNLNCEPASSATIIAIEGQNDESKTKINNLSLVSAGGKNLLIRKKITVEASLQLSGTNETSLLTVKGDGTDSKLHLPNQINDNGQYLEVHTNIPIVGHAYTTKKSKPKDVVDGDIALGKPENWIFEESLITLFTWATGAISSSWDESRNWIPRGTPYENHEVLIPAGASFYPVLSVNNKHAKVVTIKSHAVLDLASHIIEATSSNTAQIILEGTLKMEGTSVQKAWFENANENNKIIIKTDSLVEYYGTSTDTVWQGAYQNLTTSRDLSASSITVEKIFNIIGTTSAPVGITTTNQQEYKGDVTSTRSLTFTARQATFQKKLVASGENLIFATGNLKTEDIITAKNINITPATSKWESYADITVTESIMATGIDWKALSGNITLAKDIIADGLVQTEGKVILNGTGIQNIKSKQIKMLEVVATSDAKFNNTITPQKIDVVTNEGHITILSGTTVEIANKLENKNASTFTTESGSNITCVEIDNSGTITINPSANIILSHIKNKSSGTFRSDSSLILKMSLANAGIFEVKSGATLNCVPSADSIAIKNEGELTVTTLSYTPTPSATTLTIEGQNDKNKTKITNLYFIGAGGKNLIIKKKVTIEASLQLSGTNETSLLIVKGDGSDSQLHLPNPISDNGQYLEVHTNIPIVGNEYTTRKSRPKGSDSEIASGKPINWIFDDPLFPLRWKSGGAVPTKWSEAENWNPKGIPSVDTVVTIPAITVSTSLKYPKLNQNENAKVVTVDSNAEFDLSSYVINTTSSTAKLDVSGKLKMEGTNIQRAWFENANAENKIIIKADSIVEYYGTLTDSVWQGTYQNLTTSRDLSASSITVEKIFNIIGTISTPISITTTNQQEYKGDVNSVRSLTFTARQATFKKRLLASGVNFTFANGNLRTEDIITAQDITITGSTSNWDLIGAVTAKNINIAGATWKSSSNINIAENITAPTVDWQATEGYIQVAGNILANKLVQSGGAIELNGSALQELKAKSLLLLEINNTSSTDKVKVSFDECDSFILKKGKASLEKEATITKYFANEGGTFDAVEKKAIVNLKPSGMLTIRGLAKITNASANTANTGTRFYQLHCRNAGGKILKFEGAIEVLYDISGNTGFIPFPNENFSQDAETLILEGSASSHLNILGDGQIWFNQTPPFPKAKKGGKFLHVASTPEIRGGLYRVANGTYEEPKPKGWIFEEYATMLASLAITNSNEVCILFNTQVAKPPANSLKITSSSFAPMTSVEVLSYPKGSEATNKSDKWIYRFNETFTSDILLEKNALIEMGNSLDDFIFEPSSDLYPHKRGYVSDIGLNLLENIIAKNTKKITDFDGSKQLPFINTSFLADVPSDSLELTLYVSPTSEKKYWIPQTTTSTWLSNLMIDPSMFLMTIKEDTASSVANTKAFVMPTSVPEFKSAKGVEFMFCYDDLPCARLTDGNDVFSFELWKFNFLKTTLQRGGVSIFNNVINPNLSQETTIEVTSTKAGILTIQVMSIDGNIVKTVVDEYKSAGNYSYHWDGCNESGNMVARGLYFVRIVGKGIDEVRKVLVVRD